MNRIGRLVVTKIEKATQQAKNKYLEISTMGNLSN